MDTKGDHEGGDEARAGLNGDSQSLGYALVDKVPIRGYLTGDRWRVRRLEERDFLSQCLSEEICSKGFGGTNCRCGDEYLNHLVLASRLFRRDSQRRSVSMNGTHGSQSH